MTYLLKFLFFIAMSSNNWDVVNILIKQGEGHHVDYRGRIALIYAIINKQ